VVSFLPAFSSPLVPVVSAAAFAVVALAAALPEEGCVPADARSAEVLAGEQARCEAVLDDSVRAGYLAAPQVDGSVLLPAVCSPDDWSREDGCSAQADSVPRRAADPIQDDCLAAPQVDGSVLLRAVCSPDGWSREDGCSAQADSVPRQAADSVPDDCLAAPQVADRPADLVQDGCSADRSVDD
jgi:hypothetical protein